VQLEQLTREAEAARLIYQHFLARLQETSVQAGIQQADARVITPALTPTGPYSPQKLANLVLGMFIGGLVGAAFVFVREQQKKTFLTSEDIERSTGQVVLAEIPLIARARERAQAIDYLVRKPNSAVAEAIRNLRTSIVMSSVDKPPQVIMVTSAVSGEGKTTMSIGLAHNFSGMGKRVLLVEGDIRRRTFGKYFSDIAPVGYEHSHAGYVAAMAGVDLTGVTRRGAVDPMLAEAVPEAPLRAFLLQNLVIEEGRARWRLNLDVLAREMWRLTGWDVPPGRYDGPALFLRGGASPYVADDHRPAIEALFPTAEIRTLEGLGHWLHAEAPDRFLGAVRDWLAR